MVQNTKYALYFSFGNWACAEICYQAPEATISLVLWGFFLLKRNGQVKAILKIKVNVMR